jgi:hypothetical protein
MIAISKRAKEIISTAKMVLFLNGKQRNFLNLIKEIIKQQTNNK